MRELCEPLGTMAVRGGEQLRRSTARLSCCRMSARLLRMHIDVPQRSTSPDHASLKQYHLVPRCSDGRLSTRADTWELTHDCATLLSGLWTHRALCSNASSRHSSESELYTYTFDVESGAALSCETCHVRLMGVTVSENAVTAQT